VVIRCVRCGQEAEPPPESRVAHMGSWKAAIQGGICGACWREWEGVEVKVINEYRLSFMEPEHREMLRRACAEYLRLSPQA